MDLDGAVRVGLVGDHLALQPVIALPEEVDEAANQGIVESGEQPLVKGPILVTEELSALGSRIHLVHDRLKGGEIRRADPIHHHPKEAHFQGLPDLVQFSQRLAVVTQTVWQVLQNGIEGEGPHEDAVSVLSIDDAQRLEALHRLPEREAAYAKLAGKGCFGGKGVAGPQMVAPYVLFQLSLSLTVERDTSSHPVETPVIRYLRTVYVAPPAASTTFLG